LRGRFQRASDPVSSSARDNSSSSIEDHTRPSFCGSDRTFRRVVFFFFLTVMTQSYARNRHDATFPVEHFKIRPTQNTLYE
jgi:hypothetical protein